MKPKYTDKIVIAHKRNFETLTKAFKDNATCLMECTVRSTGEKVAVICTVVFDGKEYQFTPFAQFYNGNPYEILDPPKP